MSDYDLAIIGGGINGAGIAREAAGRGLKVYLCEQEDLASATSSSSTKLIHGGLRYLEHYEFKLVAKALAEREVLLQIAPHIAWPMRFVLPHEPGIRPRWMIRLGLFLYDRLGGRKILPGSNSVNLATDPVGKVLKSEYTHGFEYSDCWVDDARLVVLNAMDARERGATIDTRTKCVRADSAPHGWNLMVEDAEGQRQIKAKALVNAGGPWVVNCITDVVGAETKEAIRLVRGSHIVVPKLYDHDKSYIFQNKDGRIIFAIPYQGDFTLLGTTDVDHEGSARDAVCSADEIEYICSAASEYFAKEIPADAVVWTYSGVRPLYDDGSDSAQEATRDYVIKTRKVGKGSALVNIFGGKITTYRKLAERVMTELEPHLKFSTDAWSGEQPLPGGDFPVADVEAAKAALYKEFTFFKPRQLERIFVCYGTRAKHWLGNTKAASDLGEHFGAGLYQREVDYLMECEWAQSAEDVVWRRTKLGLRMSAKQIARVDSYMAESRKTVEHVLV